MKIVIDPNEIKVKHLELINDINAGNMRVVIEFLSQFAQDDNGAPVEPAEAVEFIREMPVVKFNALLFDLAAKLGVNPQTAAS